MKPYWKLTNGWNPILEENSTYSTSLRGGEGTLTSGRRRGVPLGKEKGPHNKQLGQGGSFYTLNSLETKIGTNRCTRKEVNRDDLNLNGLRLLWWFPGQRTVLLCFALQRPVVLRS
jgi:hypothetical protein